MLLLSVDELKNYYNRIRDPEGKQIAVFTFIGAVEQISASAEVLSYPDILIRLRDIYRGPYQGTG